MNPSHTIKRLEAMENFLEDMITKLQQHSGINFLLELSRETGGSEFDKGSFYAQTRIALQLAEECLRKTKNRVGFTIRDLREGEEGEQPKLF